MNPLADGDESVTDLTDRISKQLQDNVISKRFCVNFFHINFFMFFV